MRVFVVLGLDFFSYQAKRLAWGNITSNTPIYIDADSVGERLLNDLFCVE